MGQEMEQDEIVARIGKALAHPARVRILRVLAGGERCGCELVPLLELDPSVVSRHLAILSGAGLVLSRREGVRVIWKLAGPEIKRLLEFIEEVAP